MAQLRCAHTSELLAEGTPLEIATAASAFADADIFFDDVGHAFDASAVRKFRADEISGLQAVVAATPAKPDAAEKRIRDDAQASIAERQARIDAGKALVATARERQQAARSRVEERRAHGG